MKNNDERFFTEPIDIQTEAREQALEVICRLFIWISEGTNPDDRGLRATVALWCVRPDLLGTLTLEQIGELSGRSRQAVHQLADSFRLTTGWPT